MLKRKQVRQKGKIRLSRYFQEFNEGDWVAIVRELGLPAAFPKRMQGRTGKVLGKRGSVYVVSIKDFNQEKVYYVAPIHLKKVVINQMVNVKPKKLAVKQ